MIQINLFAKQKQTYNILTKRLSILKTNYGYQRENMGVKDKSGDRDEHTHTTTIYKIDNQQ